MAEESTNAIQAYVTDVREGRFPEDVHCYRMIKGESEKLKKLSL